MLEFILDVNRAPFAPRYIHFEIQINENRYYGYFTIVHMEDPYYKTTHLTFEDFGSLDGFKRGNSCVTIEKIPSEQIKIVQIVDSLSTRNPTPLSRIVEISENIYNLNTSSSRYKIKETALLLLEELKTVALEYGREHPTSNYQTLISYINQKLPEVNDFDKEKFNEEEKNKEVIQYKLTTLKDEIKKWVLDLLFSSPQN